VDCPKRTGHNKLLFSDLGKLDACTSPSCYQAKVDAHVAKAIAAKPKLVQISTAYGQQKEGSATLPRNKYVEVRPDKPGSKEEATRPEFKTCKYTTEAIVSEGIDKGELRKVCTEPTARCITPSRVRRRSRTMPSGRPSRRSSAGSKPSPTQPGIRVLAAMSAAVPVRLMKRDLLFILERLVSVLDENRLEMLARQHGIRQKRDDGGIGKTLAAYIRRADEGTLSRLLVETTILLAASRTNAATVLRDAATAYRVDTDAITLKVKQEFAAKAKAKKDAKPVPKARKAA
jgi:ParB family chromosome partitioning protein